MIELNKIYNKNAYEAIKEIPSDFIDCVYIDIPYLHTQGGTSASDLGARYNKRKLELKQYNEILSNNKDVKKHNLLRVEKYNAEKRLSLAEMDLGIDYSIFDDLCRVMKKINIFIWCSKLQILDIMKYFVDKKHCHFEILTWAKTNAMPTNNSMLCDLEYCFYFREAGLKLNNAYECKSKWYLSGTNKSDKEKFKHPTIKPLAFVQQHIQLATKPNDIVLDCFLGSGTTAVACKNLNRNYIGFEINKTYYDIATDRLNNLDANGNYSMFSI